MEAEEYYTEHKPKNENRGGLGTRLEKTWEKPILCQGPEMMTQLVCNVDSFRNDSNVATQYAASTASDRTVKFA